MGRDRTPAPTVFRTADLLNEVTSIRVAKTKHASLAALPLLLLLVSFVIAGPQTPSPRSTKNPAHWWAPVSEVGKPDWEILPQEAAPGEVILSKRNELGLLSNFAATPFVFHGKHYASIEGFWQMMLYPEDANDPRANFQGIEWKYTREQVSRMTAFEAKTAGTLAEDNMRRMNIDWVSFEGKRFPYRIQVPAQHYRLIVAATWAKLRQNMNVRRVLLSTGDLILKPDHHGEPNAPPEWKYYEIWMRIRNRLQQPRTSQHRLR
jgi:hypothetical protein